MKHLFFVSSHLTFFLAHRIVEYKGLDAKDCCMFMVRGYRIPQPYSDLYSNQIHTTYNVEKDVGRVFAGANIIKTKRNIREFDHLIDPFLQGEDFYWYTSVCSNDICSLMVTKSNCRGYYVTEDGLASYREYNPQTFTGYKRWIYRWLLKPLWPRIFEVKDYFITTDHAKFKGCIATSKMCFPLHQDCLEVVGSPFGGDYEGERYDCVVSIDPIYQFVGREKIEDVYRQMASFIEKKGYKRIGYKYHPRFDSPLSKDNRDYFQGLIERYFKGAVLLDKDTILENLLASTKADFYSFNSSVAIYASLSGSCCYNIAPLLKDTPAYERVWIIDRCTIPIEI